MVPPFAAGVNHELREGRGLQGRRLQQTHRATLLLLHECGRLIELKYNLCGIDGFSDVFLSFTSGHLVALGGGLTKDPSHRFFITAWPSLLEHRRGGLFRFLKTTIFHFGHCLSIHNQEVASARLSHSLSFKTGC